MKMFGALLDFSNNFPFFVYFVVKFNCCPHQRLGHFVLLQSILKESDHIHSLKFFFEKHALYFNIQLVL